ncbi:MAG: hypothetical protein VXZ82_25325 [Planctomycetota bacterium]|nr:hypothetical protein [Planctomycetota bacterium]
MTNPSAIHLCSLFRSALLAGMILSQSWCASEIYAQNASDQEVKALIEQLHSPVFKEREAATEALLALGTRSVAALRVLESENLEATTRADAILKKIEETIFKDAAQQFLRKGAEPDPDIMPSWRHYSSIVGRSRSAKLLFLDMLRVQREFAKLIELHTESPTKENTVQVRTATEKLAAELTFLRTRKAILPELGDIVAVLMGASLLEGQAPVPVNEFLVISSYTIPVTKHIDSRGYGQALKSLFAIWIPKIHESRAADAMRIALRYKYATVAELARRYVTENYDARTRERAIQCLAEFGNEKTDLPLLIKLLDDGQICDQFALNQFLSLPNDIRVTDENPPQAPFGKQDDAPDPNARFEYRIQDIALAACMMLVEEDLEQVFQKPLVPPAYVFGRFQLAIQATAEARKKRSEQIGAWKSKLKKRANNSSTHSASDATPNGA